jgi:Ca-activated chloride channel family protein
MHLFRAILFEHFFHFTYLSQHSFMQKEALQFNLIPENKYYLSGSASGSNTPGKLYLYFEVTGKKHEVGQDRIPLNISMVIDKSGSMAGEKLENVKKALDFVIDQLRSEDRLSVVEYDNLVSVLQPQQHVRDKAALHKKVKGITSGSTTNLSGGMLEGYTQVRGSRQDGLVNRVLLLSDGLANEGVTEPAAIQQIAQKKFRQEGIALSTFGVGADYNEDLMTNLSEYGGGNYYFIESADKIPEMFAHELQGLLAVVAQRTQVSIRVPRGVKFSQVFGYLSEVQGDTVTINFNDVFSEEEKPVVVEFELTDQAEGDLTFISTLSYEDVVETMGHVEVIRETTVSMTSDPEAFKDGLNVKALDNVAQFRANALLEKAIEAMDKFESERAKKLLAEAKAYLDGIFKVLSPSDSLRALYQQIIDYDVRMETLQEVSAEEYRTTQKMAKATSYYRRKGKRL